MHHIEIVSQLEGQHLEQLPALLDAAAHADGHEPVGEHKFLRLQRGEDLSVAMLAFEHGALAGYAHTVTYGAGDARRVSCEFVVHPGQRRKGIGKLLLDRAVQHAQDQEARKIDIWAYNDSPASARIAAQFGFEPARRLLHLHRHIGETPHAETPKGATLRSFRPGEDDEAWLRLNNRIFSGHPENGSWTLEDLHARMAQPWFRPEDLLMLEVDGRLAGFCWVKIEQRDEHLVGEIYVIGTGSEFRGMGLGKYLLAEALRHMRDRGTRLAAIYVDESNSTAVALYEAVGFHYHHVDVCYSRKLPVATRRPRAEAAA